MKKTIAVMLIIITIIFTYVRPVAAIDFGFPQSVQELQQGVDINNYNSVMDTGEVDVEDENGTNKTKTKVESKEGGNYTITKIISRLVVAVPTFINFILSQIMEDRIFTIKETISNQYDLFKLEYLINGKSADAESSQDTKDILEKIQNNVAIWFVSIRNLSLVGSILTLIYIAIRLALSTVSSEKTKYKEMALSWLEGIALLIILQFIIILIINASALCCNILLKFMGNETGADTIEQKIMENLSDNINQAVESDGLIAYLLLYTVISVYELKFFILYLFRVIKVAFYIIISPLICLLYPIDKVGDGKPQSFNNWMREFSITVFMQPIHLIIYIIFISSAGEIFMKIPLLGVIFFGALSHGEKIVKDVLNIKPKLGKNVGDVKLIGK